MRELNKISKNIFVLIFIMVIALVIAMTPFQKESAHALLPSSSNMRSSIDYSGQGTIINGKTTGDPAYTTTRSINGSNQQVVAVPIYQGGYKVKGLWSSRSDWKVKGASTNITNRFATSSGVMYYYQFETKTQYEWNRKGKKKWSFSRPVAIFPVYKKTGKTRTMYRYRTKKAVWDSELNKTVEYVPLNYSHNNSLGTQRWEYSSSLSPKQYSFGEIATLKAYCYYISNEDIITELRKIIGQGQTNLNLINWESAIAAGSSLGLGVASLFATASIGLGISVGGIALSTYAIDQLIRNDLLAKKYGSAQNLLDDIRMSGASVRVMMYAETYSAWGFNHIKGDITISLYNTSSVPLKLPNELNQRFTYNRGDKWGTINYLSYNNAVTDMNNKFNEISGVMGLRIF